MFRLKALSIMFLSIALLRFERRMIRNRSAITSFVYVSHDLKSFIKHARTHFFLTILNRNFVSAPDGS